MIARHIREGIKNLLRNGWMTFASVSAVAITLMVLGVSLVIALNAQQMSNYVSGQLEVDVFLQTSVSDSQGQQVAEQVRQLPGIQSVQFVSKEAGFKSLQANVGKDNSGVLDGLSATNTLPVKLVVKASDPKQILTVGQEIRALPGVAQVNDGKSFVDKLLHFLDVLRNIGLAFVVGLIVTAMFLISNTIKITIFSRRREIEIMKLVGATNWFIRWPFFMEGLIIGTLGAGIPYLIIVFGYNSMYAHIGGTFFEVTFPLLSTVFLATKLAVVLFGLGVLIGVWGGVMSVRKFLRI